MDEQSFDQLTEQAAAGLKADGELFLDVKQELRSHLEEKAEHFEAEGHTPEESIELSRKAFGSPLDVAAELLDANRRRMKLRGLMRAAFGALVVPLAVLLALYLGYGRVAHLAGMVTALHIKDPEFFPRLPMLPFYGPGRDKSSEGMEFVRQLAGDQKNAGNIRRYWAEHRNDPGSYMYYAYYANYLDRSNTDERTFIKAMRLGERIEPRNALYNVRLAEYFLENGMRARGEKFRDEKEKMLDRSYFESGISELRKAAGKPYLRAYNMPVMHKKLDAMSPPVFLEDYLTLVSICTQDGCPYLIRCLHLAKKIPGCARILLSQGRSKEAEDVMDTWKPYTKLLLNDQGGTQIYPLVAIIFGTTLLKEAPAIYTRLGEHSKAEEAGKMFERLSCVRQQWLTISPDEYARI